ncbi:MAG TPA: hypothetical protein VNK82_03165 [Terriglobales bacterium]|nr:hypothetical protein [Terriglobales bacterium]
MSDKPKLLVDWEPRWRNFTTSLRPALQREAPLPVNYFRRNGGAPALLVEWDRPLAGFSALGIALGRDPALPAYYFEDFQPALLVEWEEGWGNFFSCVAPALKLSAPRLANECDHLPLTPRGLVGALAVLAASLAFATLLAWRMAPAPQRQHIALLPLEPLIYAPPVVAQPRARALTPRELARARERQARQPTPNSREASKPEPNKPEEPPQVQVVLQPSPNLPRMEDVGGAEAGRSGRSGGREAFHPTQVIRISRGPRLVERVADAPKLNLPKRNDAVANLVAVAAAPPPPLPMAAVARGTRLGISMPEPRVVAPAPNPRRSVASLNVPQTPTVVVPPPPDIRVPPGTVTDPKLAVPLPTLAAPSLGQRSLREIATGTTGTGIIPEVASAGSPQGTGNAASEPDVASDDPNGRPEGQVAAAHGAGTDPEGSPDGTAEASGLVISTSPGDAVGVPGESVGTLAMSPAGSGTTGAGGSGGGTGIGVGTGSGSGAHGTGPGAAGSGTGFGADAGAHGGISPGPGPGGTGSGTSRSGLAGVTIRGGVVNLPSFATAGAPAPPGRTPTEGRRVPTITVIATPRSGGALPTYGLLKGPRVYTIYIQTRLGTGVLQYSERPKDIRGFQSDLTAPEPLRADFPPGTPMARVIVACVLDRSGFLKDLRVVSAASQEVAGKVMEALKDWRFRPVLRGNEVIEVDALLGFSVGTQ